MHQAWCVLSACAYTRAMKNLSPFGALLIFGFIGLLTGKFGLWFPLGLLAAVVIAVAQNGRRNG